MLKNYRTKIFGYLTGLQGVLLVMGIQLDIQPLLEIIKDHSVASTLSPLITAYGVHYFRDEANNADIETHTVQRSDSFVDLKTELNRLKGE